jgi:myo-inositol-1(or 4)-monophosphatase
VRGSSAAPPLKLPLSLSVKPLPSLHEALIGTLFITINAIHPELVPAVEWGSDRSQTAMSAKASSFSRLAGNPEQGVVGGKMAHSLRSVGSAAINFCLVAQGALDMYWCVRQLS